MTISAVFFDLDDTLCDTIGTREARARLSFEALALERPDLDREEFVARVMEPAGDRVVRGVPAVLRELGVTETPGGVAAAALWFFEGCLSLLRCLDGVQETVAALSRDYVLGVITNGDEKLQSAKLAQLGLNKHTRHLIVSDAVGYEKPDARIFAHALSLSGIEPRETVFVGDRLDIDIAGAKAARMGAVWFNHWGGSLDGVSPRPDGVIERFAELSAVLGRLAGG